MLSADNITRVIAGREILKNVSLSLANGEILSVIGPSGAGKTSLLRAMALLDPPDAGSITIGEQTYSFPHSPDPGSQALPPYPYITAVFQQLFLWPHLTVRENILLPLRGKVDGEHFNEVIDLFSMREFLDRYPNEVSMGQRQRAALVRALLLKPSYLLLDEVTSALDVEQSYLIMSHLQDIAKQGVGIILATHALHFASKISSKIVFLENGAVIESGPGTILLNPTTKRLQRFVGMSEETI